MQKLLTAQELAEHLTITPATVHAWHRRGWIPCLRASRRPVLFDLDEVLHALRQRALTHRDGFPGGQEK
jgi:DNA-binding transcriptional MerR regulator